MTFPSGVLPSSMLALQPSNPTDPRNSYYDQVMDSFMSWTNSACNCAAPSSNKKVNYQQHRQQRGRRGRRQQRREVMMMDKLFTFVQYSAHSDEGTYDEDDSDYDEDHGEHKEDYDSDDDDEDFPRRECNTMNGRKATPRSNKKIRNMWLPERGDGVEGNQKHQQQIQSPQSTTVSKPNVDKPETPSQAGVEMNPKLLFDRHHQAGGGQNSEGNPLASPSLTNASSWFDFSSWLLQDLPLPSHNRRTTALGAETPASWAAPASGGQQRHGDLSNHVRGRPWQSMDMGEDDDSEETSSSASTATTVSMNTASFADSHLSWFDGEEKNGATPPKEEGGAGHDQPRQQQQQKVENKPEEEYDVKTIDESEYPLGKKNPKELTPNDLEFEGFHFPLNLEQRQCQEENLQKAASALAPDVLSSKGSMKEGHLHSSSKSATKVKLVRVCSI